MAHPVAIYDTTLRDGTQAENFNLSVEDKLRITLKFDEFGIDFVEGGWPGSNPKDVEYFKEIQNYDLKHTKVTAFGSTRLFSNPAEQDHNLNALIAAKTPGITIFGKTWDIHVHDALRIELDDNLLIIEESLRYLRPHAQYLTYDAEHFFDGFKANPEYALTTLDRAIAGGADCLALCETNGGTLPTELSEIIQAVKAHLAAKKVAIAFGIHAHN
ncbi:MAG: citramalate synthase, partial [Proteobacteria bacterium]|nr:citramalate synthase [Pseudomonadota bacterium]